VLSDKEFRRIAVPSFSGPGNPRTAPKMGVVQKQILSNHSKLLVELLDHVVKCTMNCRNVHNYATVHTAFLLGSRFLAYVRIGPWAHPASCTTGTGSFPGLKRPGCGADHPPLLVPRSRKVRTIPLPLSGLLRGTLPSPLPHCLTSQRT
jgi:hypothetical protein